VASSDSLKTRLQASWPQVLWCTLITALALNIGYLLWPEAPQAITIQPDPRTLVKGEAPAMPYLVETTPEEAKSYALLTMESEGAAPKHLATVRGSKKAATPSKKNFQGTIHLNSASAAQLELLPGIGPKTAASILTFRKQNGGFQTVEQLLDVPGIGPKTLEKIASHCKL
jgi:competence ComEA-like helix-hairpin-helix protein